MKCKPPTVENLCSFKLQPRNRSIREAALRLYMSITCQKHGYPSKMLKLASTFKSSSSHQHTDKLRIDPKLSPSSKEL